MSQKKSKNLTIAFVFAMLAMGLSPAANAIVVINGGDQFPTPGGGL